ncbi:hypothetical protein QBC43DRAFT_335315 [Cladorrhinum sp. PSN259]|nr:hypothetical protein QBC43DRAFT_335315 [Cladorrhinum sp. PSN259]
MFLFYLLPVLYYALPTLATSVWTIYDIARTCTPDDSSCLYMLDLNQNPDMDDPHSENDIITCIFNISASSFSSSLSSTRADQTEFGDVSCLGVDRLKVNGGYNSQQKFWTLVVVDNRKGEYAFFGYTDAELGDGQSHPKRAKVLSAAGKTQRRRLKRNREGSPVRENKEQHDRQTEDRRMGLKERRGEGEEESGKTWQIKDLSRVQDESKDITKTEFVIKDSDGLTAHCSFTLVGSKSDISWFGKACKGFKISWGYKPDTDGSVMTVCYPQNGTAAWFGWDGISYQTDFGDSPKRGLHEIGTSEDGER